MTLSCLPKTERQDRGSGRWRLPRRKERLYSVFKDDEDCHWLLACQPPQPSVCSEQNTIFWKDQSEATTCSDEDDNDDETTATTVSLGYDERGNTAMLFSSMSLIHLAPPSESDDSDADDSSLDEYTVASLADFFRRVTPTKVDDDDSSNKEGLEEIERNKDDAGTLASSSTADWKSTATNRSIRFADEVDGLELETTHIVPWLCAEDKDEKWVPRQVRCRVEL